MVKSAALLFFLILMFDLASAQDTLPRFTVTTRGNNRTFISWSNNYPVTTQINIQRSTDSLKNFKTILSVPDPTIQQNGFVDTKATTPYMFYRLFIVLDSGKYVFTQSKRPLWNNGAAAVQKIVGDNNNNGNGNKRVIISDTMSSKEADRLKNKLDDSKTGNNANPSKAAEPEKYFIVKRRDSIITQVSERGFKPFSDSLVRKTKDTLVFQTADTILIKPFIPKEVYKPSAFIYTERDGNVMMSIPDATSKHYSVKFFNEKNVEIFHINRIKETSLVLDKSNFLHSGWFRFELMEDGKLKEKNKFFIPRDF
ncbi:MAG: hypothetical protein H7Y31_09635 [Chitinophagaceae bacterium]|nr:hypothetical protein [Chitinophagaceae bacterium]